MANRQLAKCGFCCSKRDLLVALACIAFLVANLGAIGSTGRRRAKEAVCLSNLRQWGAIFEMFVNDNNGWFFGDHCEQTSCICDRYWRSLVYPCRSDQKMWLCPEAVIQRELEAPLDWSHTAWQCDGESGSYGLNGWVIDSDTLDPRTHQADPRYWHTPHVGRADNVPVFADMWWLNAWPRDTDPPPESGPGPEQIPGIPEMNRVCVNRHYGAVNILFADWSARKVGLKELWKVKWHRQFNTDGPWTQAGGVTPTYWPKWMRDFKDY